MFLVSPLPRFLGRPHQTPSPDQFTEMSQHVLPEWYAVCVCLSVIDWGSANYQSHFDLQADCTQISWVYIAVAIAIVIVDMWDYQGSQIVDSIQAYCL